MTDFISWDSKVTADCNCSHESKRCLLLGRKAMTNLDSVLKSKDITLPTTACIVKAIVFSVVMYRCESWNIKKAECQRIDTFKLWCYRRLLRVPWTAGRSNSPSLEGLLLKLQNSGHLMQRADAGIEGRRRNSCHQFSGHEFKQTPGDSGRQRSLACCSPWGSK